MPLSWKRRRATAASRAPLQPNTLPHTSIQPLEPRLLLALVHIGAADAAPNPTAPGGTLTLTASSVTGTVDELDFYRESNGIAGLQSATDTLVNFASPSAPGTYTATGQAPFTPGDSTYYA